MTQGTTAPFELVDYDAERGLVLLARGPLAARRATRWARAQHRARGRRSARGRAIGQPGRVALPLPRRSCFRADLRRAARRDLRLCQRACRTRRDARRACLRTAEPDARLVRDGTGHAEASSSLLPVVRRVRTGPDRAAARPRRRRRPGHHPRPLPAQDRHARRPAAEAAPSSPHGRGQRRDGPRRDGGVCGVARCLDAIGTHDVRDRADRPGGHGPAALHEWDDGRAEGCGSCARSRDRPSCDGRATRSTCARTTRSGAPPIRDGSPAPRTASSPR